MFARAIDYVSGIVAHARNLRRNSLLALIGIGGVALSASQLIPKNERQISGMTGVPFETWLVMILVASSLIVMYSFFALWPRGGQLPLPKELKEDDIECVLMRTPELGQAISGVLIPWAFTNPKTGTVETMPFDQIDEAGRKNRFMAVGIRSRREDRFVGYASFWPVKADVGRKLLRGEMTDSDLTADDVIDERRRHQCRYAIIPGAVILRGPPNERLARFHRLESALRKMIATEYLARGSGRMRLIAIGYSPPGKQWCASKMEPTGYFADYGDGERHPVFSREVCLADLVV